MRDMWLFNLALLRHQFWILINNKDILCLKVFSPKYFLDGNIVNAKRIDKASFTWLSIAVVVETFKNGFDWQVGNGNCSNIQVDNWGIEDLNGGTVNSNMLNPHEKSVRDIWIENDRRWGIDKVYKLYGKVWGDRICSLPIGNESQRDRIICGFDQGCSRCGAIAETLIHALKDCLTSREILSIGGWDTSTMSRQYDRCIDWLE
ncbi:hypothetical protein J1N35_028847 [Gossypium stocksii]|uniref:Reverse transcriptase zinc-binding domain-containing protein n=1 Tax=Gossypium stocksii TaxID=47602 RepID=A0A9D3UX56_9ROSI|nr:hypothetical protein J1N35_028847 [Gossypium stocksii]